MPKLALVMVGLPARGKTFVARKLEKYLSWFGYRTNWKNVGNYRRKFVGPKRPASYFDPDNEATRDERENIARAALDDLLDWFASGGQVGIYDAANTERGRRDALRRAFADAGIGVLFVEIQSDDPSIIDANVRRNKLNLPDYEGMTSEDAFADFKQRIVEYAKTYIPVGDAEGSYVKIVDSGRQVIVHRIEGYLLSHIAYFLMQIRPTERVIWLTRHGESEYNVAGKIGGDPPLTARGEAFGRALGEFVRRQQTPPVVAWTSTLQRTVATAAGLGIEVEPHKALDEIDAGVCENMTYAEIAAGRPNEYAERAADKFRFRYPQGESYADVIRRLEPVIVELEGQREPVLVVGHQAVLRALYGYLSGEPQERCPYLEIPLHTVIQLTPTENGYDERRFALDVTE
jgi:broad specificity phosphatase PhoE